MTEYVILNKVSETRGCEYYYRGQLKVKLTVEANGWSHITVGQKDKTILWNLAFVVEKKRQHFK